LILGRKKTIQPSGPQESRPQTTIGKKEKKKDLKTGRMKTKKRPMPVDRSTKEWRSLKHSLLTKYEGTPLLKEEKDTEEKRQVPLFTGNEKNHLSSRKNIVW